MKILIVGLIDKQASLVRARYGKRLDITFASKSTKSGNGAFLSQVEHMDHVLLLQKFCSHEISKKIPAAKKHIITGMKTLFDFLDHYDVLNHMENQEKKPAPPAPVEPPPVEAPPPDPKYMEAFDLTVARCMVPGDKVYFKRPADAKLQGWKNTFHNKVLYYRRQHNILLEVSFDGDVACVAAPIPTPVPEAAPPWPPLRGGNHVIPPPLHFDPPPAPPEPVTIGPVMVTVPAELTVSQLNKLRTDPRSRDTDVGCMDEKIGWLVRAWPAILGREE